MKRPFGRGPTTPVRNIWNPCPLWGTAENSYLRGQRGDIWDSFGSVFLKTISLNRLSLCIKHIFCFFFSREGLCISIFLCVHPKRAFMTEFSGRTNLQLTSSMDKTLPQKTFSSYKKPHLRAKRRPLVWEWHRDTAWHWHLRVEKRWLWHGIRGMTPRAAFAAKNIGNSFVLLWLYGWFLKVQVLPRTLPYKILVQWSTAGNEKKTPSDHPSGILFHCLFRGDVTARVPIVCVFGIATPPNQPRHRASGKVQAQLYIEIFGMMCDSKGK